MHDDITKPAGLKCRRGIWHIDKTIRVGDQCEQLRESTGCRALEDATRVLVRRVAETRARLSTGTIARERCFAEAAAEYLADVERRGKHSQRQEYALRAIMETIGALPLSHVHQRSIQDWIDRQQGKLASGTVGRTIQAVSTVLHFAAEVLRDGHQPWLATAPPKLRAPDWGSRQPRPITWEEQDRLVAALPAHLVAPVLFALATGARQAEITTLQWDQARSVPDIPDYSAWWIPPEVRKGHSKQAASERQGRFLVANRAARSVLQGQRGLSPTWVFPSPLADGLFRVNNHGWKTATKKAGLPIRFHDLRHTFGQRAADAGIPFDVRKSLLGHEHHDITAHYSSPGLARLLEEAERIVRPAPVLKMVVNG